MATATVKRIANKDKSKQNLLDAISANALEKSTDSADQQYLNKVVKNDAFMKGTDKFAARAKKILDTPEKEQAFKIAMEKLIKNPKARLDQLGDMGDIEKNLEAGIDIADPKDPFAKFDDMTADDLHPEKAKNKRMAAMVQTMIDNIDQGDWKPEISPEEKARLALIKARGNEPEEKVKVKKTKNSVAVKTVEKTPKGNLVEKMLEVGGKITKSPVGKVAGGILKESGALTPLMIPEIVSALDRAETKAQSDSTGTLGRLGSTINHLLGEGSPSGRAFDDLDQQRRDIETLKRRGDNGVNAEMRPTGMSKSEKTNAFQQALLSRANSLSKNGFPQADVKDSPRMTAKENKTNGDFGHTYWTAINRFLDKGGKTVIDINGQAIKLAPEDIELAKNFRVEVLKARAEALRKN